MSRIKSYRNDNKTLTRGAVPLVVTLMSIPLVGILALPSNTFAEGSSTDASVDELVVTVPVFCTLTSNGNDSHNAEIDGGTYRADIGTTTIKAICNDNEGFSIYATGYTGNEIGTENSNKLVSGTNTIITGTSTGPVSGNDTSNWAMKLSTTSSPTPAYPITIESDAEGTFSNYHTVPNTYTKVATRASSTDVGDEAIGSTFTTTYATYISGTQAPGTYTGQVKYTLVHPTSEIPLQPQTATSGCINYFPNGGNVEGTMGCQSISTSATSATLLASNFSRSGYGFAGWSDVYDYATNPNAKFYGPQETITFTAGQYTGTNNGLSLYAVWVKSQGSIQDTTKVAELCGTGANALATAPTDGTANLASVSALTDQRDNQTYAIAKLADGKCWMIENLRLDNTNSDNSTGALAQGYGTSTTYGNFSGLADPESANFTESTTANSLYYSGTQDGTASIDIGTSNYPGVRMPRYNNTNTSARVSSPTTNSVSMYSYGNYYTWHAAIADIAHNGTTNNSSNTTSLCPSGWRLPQGGDKTRITSNDDNDFWNLTVDALNNGTNPANYDSQTRPYYNGTTEAGPVADKLRAYPNNFLKSGLFYTSLANNRGSDGYYWSSTAHSNRGSYYLRLFSSYVHPGTSSNDKYSGFSVRCMVSAGT